MRRRKEEFFIKYIASRYEEVYAYIFSWLGNESDTKDAAQITMEKAWKSMEKLRKPSSVKSWLYQIAYTTSMNTLRRRARP